MKSELHFCGQKRQSGTLRNKSRFLNPLSPLLKVNWWRTCLDEAQMVEKANNNCSKMVKSLPGKLKIKMKAPTKRHAVFPSRASK